MEFEDFSQRNARVPHTQPVTGEVFAQGDGIPEHPASIVVRLIGMKLTNMTSKRLTFRGVPLGRCQVPFFDEGTDVWFRKLIGVVRM